MAGRNEQELNLLEKSARLLSPLDTRLISSSSLKMKILVNNLENMPAKVMMCEPFVPIISSIVVRAKKHAWKDLEHFAHVSTMRNLKSKNVPTPPCPTICVHCVEGLKPFFYYCSCFQSWGRQHIFPSWKLALSHPIWHIKSSSL